MLPVPFFKWLSQGVNMSQYIEKCLAKPCTNSIVYYIAKFKNWAVLRELVCMFSETSISCLDTLKNDSFFSLWWMNKVSIFRFQFYFLHIPNAIVDLWPLNSCISLHVVHSWLALLKWTRQSAWFRVILEVEGKNDSLLEEFPKLNDRGMGFSPCMVS